MKNDREKIAVILNTNQLGGAERSLFEQLHGTKEDKEFTFFVPALDLPDAELKEFLSRMSFSNVKTYFYPSFFYKLSRRDYHKLPIIIMSLPFLLLHLIRWNGNFRHFSKFYVNGNKAIFPLLCWSVLYRKSISVLWHFRDFPSPRAFQVISKILKLSLFKTHKFKIIANSEAVARDLKQYFANFPIECIYNLAGQLPVKKPSGQLRHIGVVSMLAPWKGLHSVVLMAKLYEKELKDLGIERITFFGEAIYQTAGEHQCYSEQVKKLTDKLGVNWINWAGKIVPCEIFSQIDLLVHPSIMPEPFGRVIIEAFKTHVPVISTGIGGASELIGDNNQFGLKFEPYDYQGLFINIRNLASNPQEVRILTERSFEKALSLESGIKTQVKSIFNI